MEFPDLGEQCSLPDCRRLDFLPIKCSACKQIYCSNHFRYEAHKCQSEHNDDNQVPVCPLCNKPVTIKPGESPDYKVSEHIDKNCLTQQEKVFKNRCEMAGCKKRELMPLNCESCKKNHCLQHRHPTDHKCTGPSATSGPSQQGRMNARANQFLDQLTRKSANAYESIRTNVASTISNVGRSMPQSGNSGTRQAPSSIAALQGTLTEEEALNIAIQESLMSANNNNNTGNNAQQNQTAQKCRVS